MICPSSSRHVAKLAGREACMVNSAVAREQAHRRYIWCIFEPTRGQTKCMWCGVVKGALESSAMNAVTRRDDYRPAGPYLL